MSNEFRISLGEIDLVLNNEQEAFQRAMERNARRKNWEGVVHSLMHKEAVDVVRRALHAHVLHLRTLEAKQVERAETRRRRANAKKGKHPSQRRTAQGSGP